MTLLQWPSDLRPDRGRLKILLVEDNESDVWLFCEAFEALGIEHDVKVARDGEAALKILKNAPVSDFFPELVLLDINLPKIDGFGVLSEMRANPHLKSIPVIVLSSSRDPNDVRRAHELGANSYLHKSVHDYADLIGDLDRYWLKRAELPLRR